MSSNFAGPDVGRGDRLDAPVTGDARLAPAVCARPAGQRGYLLHVPAVKLPKEREVSALAPLPFDLVAEYSRCGARVESRVLLGAQQHRPAAPELAALQGRNRREWVRSEVPRLWTVKAGSAPQRGAHNRAATRMNICSWTKL